jgi:hypothetical protein
MTETFASEWQRFAERMDYKPDDLLADFGARFEGEDCVRRLRAVSERATRGRGGGRAGIADRPAPRLQRRDAVRARNAKVASALRVERDAAGARRDAGEEKKEDHKELARELEWEVRLWASFRAQTVARTLRGANMYNKALRIRSLLEDAAFGYGGRASGAHPALPHAQPRGGPDHHLQRRGDATGGADARAAPRQEEQCGRLRALGGAAHRP